MDSTFEMDLDRNASSPHNATPPHITQDIHDKLQDLQDQIEQLSMMQNGLEYTLNSVASAPGYNPDNQFVQQLKNQIQDCAAHHNELVSEFNSFQHPTWIPTITLKQLNTYNYTHKL